MLGHAHKKAVQRGAARQDRAARKGLLNEGALHGALKEGQGRDRGELYTFILNK